MIIQLTRSRTIVQAEFQDIGRVREEFDRQHSILLRQLLAPELLRFVQCEISRGEFYERVHRDITPPAVDLCMKSNRASALLHFFVNDEAFLGLMQRMTGIDQIGSFSGNVYSIVPGQQHHDSWHSDSVGHRVLAMSINLSAGVFRGGVLEIRQRQSGEIVRRLANTGFGDGIVFRIARHLEHRVTDLEGAVRRTAFAGWFSTEPKFAELLKP